MSPPGPVDSIDLQEQRARLAALDVPDVVHELGRLAPTGRAVAFRLLDKGRAVEVFEDLDPALQAELVASLQGEAASIFGALDPDDRAALLDEVPAGVARRLLAALAPDERVATASLLGYPEGSAGRRMSPEVVAVHVGTTVGATIDRVRAAGEDAETVYLVPVVGDGLRVEGVVSLRRLVLSDPATPVEDVMTSPATTVHATDDAEDAANVVRDGGFVGVPVVDGEDRLVGVLTVDDAMRVLEAEDDEDSARTGGTEPLRRPYLSVSVLGLVRSRVVWLLMLIVAASLTVGVQSYFEDELAQVVALALFVPLLIGTGGNAGSQAATTVVRASAVGDVRTGDVARVVGREMLTGLLLGITLAVVGVGPAILVAGPQIGVVLALTVVAVCTLATTVGSSVPLLAKRVGIDPAIVSAPFISTFVDTTGLIVYFSIAKAVLGI
ncbi:magnesium transporter [Cellulomonas phragmiteti]|uniref:Magnesium transporter MgtE n=1 Tax=Cellulomonas phragmiteti TaxID=478780 RepID=A0ABQ4DMA2_9CELL|nr:magnesium transporter [Cellulomonas phragmiteti]GIG40117.1 magnesium transporter MgtE [Cellulomonas phragmiteti]